MIERTHSRFRDVIHRLSEEVRTHGPVRMLGPVLLALLLLVPVSGRAAAPQAEPAKVNVGFSNTKPGEPLDLPLTLSALDPLPVGKLVAGITFPKNALSFDAAELALAGEQSEAQIATAVKEVPGESSLSLLEFTMTTKGTLRPGILAYIKFRVSTEAKKGSLSLKWNDLKATSPDGQPVSQVAKGKDGTVVVFNLDEDIPVVGCFFFTH